MQTLCGLLQLPTRQSNRTYPTRNREVSDLVWLELSIFLWYAHVFTQGAFAGARQLRSRSRRHYNFYRPRQAINGGGRE